MQRCLGWILLFFCALTILTGCGAMSPEASATASSQSVSLGDSITLSAAGSDQRNGDTLTYRWSITAAPAGSQAQLSTPTAVETLFTPDLVGDYEFTLVVDNDFHTSEPVKLKVRCVASGQPIPRAVATDSSGTLTLWDLTAIENSRAAGRVNFSLDYSLENTGTTRANLSVIIYGRNAAEQIVYTRTLTAGVDQGTTLQVRLSLGEALTVTEYDTITTWTADPITVTP